jgi:hypothetical protein
MKRLLTILFLLSLFTNINAQFDTEHWFAPFSDRMSAGDTEQYLYLSTNKTTPFNVEIYNNNILYKTVQISKGNPGVVAIDRDLMMTSDQTNLFTAKKMGLHLVADFKFFAHMRFAMPNHAEIVTSKGKAGLGNNFFAVMTDNSIGRSYINTTIGVIATENNTKIKFIGYNSGIIFSNGVLASAQPTINITLNKGETYIIDAISNDSTANVVGLTGTQIESDKPISVTNGNFGFISPNKSNVDVLMDQSTPVERLGKEYIAMKGNGNLSTGMERPIVLATEDNTNVYINNETTPIVLNKGQHVMIDSSKNVFVSIEAKILKTKAVMINGFLSTNSANTEAIIAAIPI